MSLEYLMDANSKWFLQINLPEAGTIVDFICDGTVWYVNGQAVSIYLHQLLQTNKTYSKATGGA